LIDCFSYAAFIVLKHLGVDHCILLSVLGTCSANKIYKLVVLIFQIVC